MLETTRIPGNHAKWPNRRVAGQTGIHSFKEIKLNGFK